MPTNEIRLLHMSDVHLDASFRATGVSSEHARERCQAHLDAFDVAVEEAERVDAHLMAIAGDLFEGGHARPATGRHVSRRFEQWQRPVFIAPGNHDPLVDDSLYRVLDWPDNVHIFGEDWDSVDLPDREVTVHGRGFTAPESHERLFEGLRIRPERKNIVVAHGSDMSARPDRHAPYRPFEQSEIDRLDASYVALGHYHSFQILATEKVRAAYCGSPIPQGFNETGEHGVVLARIRSGVTEVELLTIPARRFVTLDVRLRSAETPAEIIEQVRDKLRKNEVADDFVRVRLKGFLAPDLDLDLAYLKQSLQHEVHSLDVVDVTLPEYDLEAIAKEETIRGRFVRALQEQLRDAEPHRKPIIEKAIHFGLDAFAGHPQSR